MKTTSLLLAIFLCTAAVCQADPPNRSQNVTASLSLSGYHYWIDMMPTFLPRTNYGSFSAVFTLVNRSGSDMAFEMHEMCYDGRNVQMILYDERGRAVWKYIDIPPTMACPAIVYAAILPAGSMWQYRVEVPFAPYDVVLSPGRYRLEAFIDGTPVYGATAPLEIGYAY